MEPALGLRLASMSRISMDNAMDWVAMLGARNPSKALKIWAVAASFGLLGAALAQADREIKKGVGRIAIGDAYVIGAKGADAKPGEGKETGLQRRAAQRLKQRGHIDTRLKIGGILYGKMRHRGRSPDLVNVLIRWAA